MSSVHPGIFYLVLAARGLPVRLVVYTWLSLLCGTSFSLPEMCSAQAQTQPPPSEISQDELDWRNFQNQARSMLDKQPLSRVKGSEGIPFPSAAEMTWKPMPTAAANTASQGEPSATPRPVATERPYEPPRRCERDETKREVFKTTERERVLYTDRLFIDEDLVPFDPQEALGSEVMLVPYGPKSGRASSIRMEIYRVPCLPFRIRTTNTTTYLDTGLNALRNYDRDQGGHGVLHPAMEALLFPDKRSKRPALRR